MTKIGATGDFPRGRLNAQDEGALRIAISVQQNVVLLQFGKPIAWIGLPKAEALDVARSITNYANSLKE